MNLQALLAAESCRRPLSPVELSEAIRAACELAARDIAAQWDDAGDVAA